MDILRDIYLDKKKDISSIINLVFCLIRPYIRPVRAVLSGAGALFTARRRGGSISFEFTVR